MSLSVLTTLSSIAQTADTTKPAVEKCWKKGGMGGLNFTQSSYTNWAAGGENSVAVTAIANLFANYKKGNWTWDNSVDMAYGLLKSGNVPIRKSEDKIDITSKAGRYAFKEHWYYTLLLNFKSQFDNGYAYPDDSNIVSHFLAPGYALASLGLDYKRPEKGISLFFSPVTAKFTVVNDQRLADAGAFGVTAAKYDSVAGVWTMTKHGEMLRSEFGGYLKFTFKKDIFKNVNFATKLELFSNYLKDPQNIDVLWENILTLKVNKYFNASVTTNMIYDHDIPVPVERTINGVVTPGTGPRLQFKEVLAIGVSYKF